MKQKNGINISNLWPTGYLSFFITYIAARTEVPRAALVIGGLGIRGFDYLRVENGKREFNGILAFFGFT
jgi:hypothetical protein